MRFLARLFRPCLPFFQDPVPPATPSAPLRQVVVVPREDPGTATAPPSGSGKQPLSPVAAPTKQKARKRKKTIPKSVRLAVWSKYIGEHIGVTKCPVCRTNEIGQLRFDVAHVVAESKGGTLNIENLRPICPTCNRSMGTMNLEEFRKRFFASEEKDRRPI